MTTIDAYICAGVRTPFGQLGGALASIGPLELAASPIREMIRRNPRVDWGGVDQVIISCSTFNGSAQVSDVGPLAAEQAGLSARGMERLSRGPQSTLCAFVAADRAIRSGQSGFVISGGVGRISSGETTAALPGRASDGRGAPDTHWRSRPSGTGELSAALRASLAGAEVLAKRHHISREDQDQYSLRARERCRMFREDGFFDREIGPVAIPCHGGDGTVFRLDESSNAVSTLEALAALNGVFTPRGTVTSGNSAPLSDGACAVLIASEDAARQFGLIPRARIVSVVELERSESDSLSLANATQRTLKLAGRSIEEIDIFEFDDVFAAQGLAIARQLDLGDDAEHVNSSGGAIAMGRPVAAAGIRLLLTALNHLERVDGRYAVCAAPGAAGTDVATLIERLPY